MISVRSSRKDRRLAKVTGVFKVEVDVDTSEGIVMRGACAGVSLSSDASIALMCNMADLTRNGIYLTENLCCMVWSEEVVDFVFDAGDSCLED